MATPDDRPNPAIDTIIIPRARDIGGFEVRRALPARERQMVGPFIFFDHIGPAELLVGTGIDVRPHPHIGLSTMTWLIDGEIRHKDSLGSDQVIRPGEVNWMTAGSGIVHSERSPEEARSHTQHVFGIQTWLALPRQDEETDPAFEHFAAEALPVIEAEGLRAVVAAGTAWGERSPVGVYTETLYVDAMVQAGATLPVPDEHEERAIYLLSGEIEIAGERFAPGSLLVLRPGDGIAVRAVAPSRLILLGGEPMDGPRHLWWNLVSSSKQRIEQAKADWKAGRFESVAGDPEYIPLPED